MTAIVFPHVYCNDGIITDLSGYGCIPGNLGLREINTAGVATGSLGSTGYAILPIMINDTRKTLIIQWGK
ncbi:hypothetical protein ABTW34_04905, partial [Morganella morganii]